MKLQELNEELIINNEVNRVKKIYKLGLYEKMDTKDNFNINEYELEASSSKVFKGYSLYSKNHKLYLIKELTENKEVYDYEVLELESVEDKDLEVLYDYMKSKQFNINKLTIIVSYVALIIYLLSSIVSFLSTSSGEEVFEINNILSFILSVSTNSVIPLLAIVVTNHFAKK